MDLLETGSECPVEIYLERNRIRISGYAVERGSPGYLPYILTVWDEKSKRYVRDKTYSHEIVGTNDVIVPRTTSLQRILSRLKSGGCHNPKIIDKSNENLVPKLPLSEPIELRSNIHLRDYQMEVADFIDEKAKNGVHYKLVNLLPGLGKTLCGIYAISKANTKTCIVANALVDQWAGELLTKTNVSYKRIYEFTGGMDSVKKALKMGNKHDIYLASLKTLTMADQEGLFDLLMRTLGIGLIIVDEMHIATYTHTYLLMQSKVQDVLYLSATPTRSAPNEAYVFKKAFENLPEFGGEIEQIPYINVIYVNYNTHPTWKIVNWCNTFYGFQTKRFAEHCFSKENRHIIFDILKWAVETTISHVEKDEKIVIIMERIADVKMTISYLKEEFPDVNIGDYTSNVKNKSEKTANLKNKIIVTTNLSFGTGSDLSGLLRVLINTTTYNSRITAAQQPKRLRPIPGKEVYYIDLVNLGFKRTFSHFLQRSKIIKGYAKKIMKRVYGEDI